MYVCGINQEKYLILSTLKSKLTKQDFLFQHRRQIIHDSNVTTELCCLA